MCVGRVVTARQKCCNVQSVLRASNIVETVCHSPSDVLAAALRGDDMVRIGLNSKLSYPEKVEDMRSEQLKHVSSFLRHVPYVELWRSDLLSQLGTNIDKHPIPSLPPVHQLCVATLDAVRTTAPDGVWTVEDKDPSVLWLQSHTGTVSYTHLTLPTKRIV